jgi:putative phosphoribosyl transferase
MKFSDHASGGKAVSTRLESYRDRRDTLVLGIVSGGAEVAFEIANYLALPLDVALISRLLPVEGPSDLICAATIAGTRVIDKRLDDRQDPVLEAYLADRFIELERRTRSIRQGRGAVELAGLNTIVVDNGIHTGGTMRTVVRALRELAPRRIIAVAPVASVEGLASVLSMVDEAVCLQTPEPFGHVGLWYDEFIRPTESQIASLLVSSLRFRVSGSGRLT